jgi:hypothetical protein
MSLAVIAGAVERVQSKPRREKVFGVGKLTPLDREAKVRIMALARALMHRTEERKHYGVLTAKFVAVLGALLWGFHNAASGKCFPSYEALATKADCSRATVYTAINALERAGLLTWVNRIKRVCEWGVDLFGRAKNCWRVERTSNAYVLIDPQPKQPHPTKSKFETGTANQDLIPSVRLAPQPADRPSFNNYDEALAASRARRVAFGDAKGLAMK